MAWRIQIWSSGGKFGSRSFFLWSTLPPWCHFSMLQVCQYLKRWQTIFFNWPWDKKLSQCQIVYDAVHFSLISSFEVYKFHVLLILKSV